jgi:4-amino-4-deoxy-L-arabinose transferase-like glycosyltransferase
VVATYVVFRNTLSKRTALVAALLLAFDPFYMAMSRVFLTDGLHAIFALLAILGLGLALARNNTAWYAASGVSAGLAFLSKSPAIFVLAPLVVFVSVVVFVLDSDRFDGRRDLLTKLAVWCAAMVICVFAVWPAMWVQPKNSLQLVLDFIFMHTTSEHWRTDTGMFFYPLVILLRGSPLVLIGAAATCLSLGNWLRTIPLRRIGEKEIWLLSLWGMVVAYVVMFSLGGHKNDLYIAPVYLAITLV